MNKAQEAATSTTSTATTPVAPKLSLVAATTVPARVVGESAKTKLAEFQAKQKADREATAAPIVAGMLTGQALTDGVVYATVADANKNAQKAKRLVDPGLTADGHRGAIRISGSEPAVTWHVLAVEKAPVTTVNTEAAPVTAEPVTAEWPETVTPIA
jgi:hypothetical protein